MNNEEKCKEEIIQIMQKYNCMFVLDWGDELVVQNKDTHECTHFTWFNIDGE